MDGIEEIDNNEMIMELTAEVVAAYVGNNSLPVVDLPTLISDVFVALGRTRTVPAIVPAEKPKPAVSIKRSVTDDYIVCLEDGKKFKSLKRHLRTRYDMTPDQYRAKWNLPSDYPMVAPNYAKHRSSLAKQIGLGTEPRGGRQKRSV